MYNVWQILNQMQKECILEGLHIIIILICKVLCDNFMQVYNM